MSYKLNSKNGKDSFFYRVYNGTMILVQHVGSCWFMPIERQNEKT